MKVFIKVSLIIVNIISLVGTVLFAIYGIHDEIMGPAASERLLEKLHIPLTYNQALFVGLACAVIMMATHILRLKMLGRM